jgi:hypothetical protein
MEQRGVSLHLMPTYSDPETWAISAFIDTWEKGLIQASQPVFMMAMKLNPEWIQEVPEDQLAAFAMELAVQIIAAKRHPDDVVALRESIAREIKALGIVNLGL